MSRYEIRRAGTGGVLSKHRTRQAALDNWRTLHAGIPVTIWRTYSSGGDVLVLEGTWHQRGAELDSDR